MDRQPRATQQTFCRVPIQLHVKLQRNAAKCSNLSILSSIGWRLAVRKWFKPLQSMPKYHPRLSPSNLQSLLAQREKFQSHRHGYWGHRNPSLVMQPSLMLATGCVCCRGPVASQTVQPRHRPSYEIALPFQHKHCGTSMQVGKNLDVWVSESEFLLSDHRPKSHTILR